MPSKLFIPVGIPGCGKSTFVQTHLSCAIEHSTDAIREELTGDASSQVKNDTVFKLFHERIALDLDVGYDVFADATNLTRKARAMLWHIADDYEAEQHLIIFGNCDQAVVRNQRRARVVPEQAMLRMLENFERFKIELIQERDHYTSITEIRSFA